MVVWHSEAFLVECWEANVEALERSLDKHLAFLGDSQGFPRIQRRVAFARIALGGRAAANRSVVGVLRNTTPERSTYLAPAIAAGIVPECGALGSLNRKGRGI